MGSKLPEIPENKSCHLFVCYEKNSLNVVEKIVDNLEQNGMMCYYYERDFLPGRSILDNIHDGLKKSLSMLIVLSEEFEESDYCKHEIDEAFNLKVTEEYNLIPIKTEPCNVPERLKHLVYIDVEDDVDGAHNKIINAVIKKDLFGDLKQDCNGEVLQFDMKQERQGLNKCTKYKLEFTDEDRANIWNNNFQVSAELLQDVEETVNGSLLVKYFHVWEFTFWFICLIFLHLLIVIFVIFLILFITTSGREKADSFQPAGYVLVIGLPVWFVSLISALCVWKCQMDNGKGIHGVKIRARRILKSKLWSLSKQNNTQAGVIFLIKKTFDYGYFANRLEKLETLKQFRREDETNEDCTSRIFDDVMREKADLLLLPSTSARHKMKNNAKCLCLLAEEFLKAKRK